MLTVIGLKQFIERSLERTRLAQIASLVVTSVAARRLARREAREAYWDKRFAEEAAREGNYGYSIGPAATDLP